MGKILSIHSFRGGTGKSNTTANLGAMIARAGKRVAIIDTDIQSPGVHVIFGLGEGDIRKTLNDFLWGRCRIEEAAHDVTTLALGSTPPETAGGRLFLVPSSIQTGEISRILREGYDVAKLNEGFQELLRKLDLDYLLVDTHPGVNEETLLSIAVADSLVLLLRPDNQDFQGTAVTVELARRLRVNRMWLVVNKVPLGVDRESLRAHVESTYQAKVAGLLPLNSEIAQLASSSLFTNQFPEHPFTRELNLVARKLME